MNWQLKDYSKALIISLLFLTWQIGLSQSPFSKNTVVVFPPDIQTWVGKKLPDFTLQDLNGTTYTSESVKGKLTILNLWSTTCHPCIEEMPLLNKLVDQYATQNVLFLAAAPEPQDKINRVLAHQPFTYTILPAANDLFKSLNLPGYPYHILVDHTGYIRSIWTGTVNGKTGQKIADKELPAAIEQALK